MNFLQKIKENKIVAFASSIYVIISTTFIIWMLFFDGNSMMVHQKFDREIDELKTTNAFFKQKIKEDLEAIEKLKDSLKLEHYAREKYMMKRKNEDIYLIEFDTIN